MIFTLFSILQAMSISLGVGSSTLAITNFFVAIWDGKIDEHERKMMGVVYVVLRVAMGLILISTVVITMYSYGSGLVVDSTVYVIWSLIFILCTNAILMTLKMLPSAFGPAIQVSGWYCLGLWAAFRLVDIEYTYFQFILGYIVALLAAVAFINMLLMYIKQQQVEKKKVEETNA